MTDHLDSALYKLGFGAGRMDSMSTDLSPEECIVLLKRIESEEAAVVVAIPKENECEHCRSALLPKRREPTLCTSCVSVCDEDCDHWPAEGMEASE